MAFGIQNKYHIAILQHFYKLTGATEVSKKNDLQCECGKPGCGTLHEVEFDLEKYWGTTPGQGGWEHTGPKDDRYRGCERKFFAYTEAEEQVILPDSMWIGTDCVCEFTPECDELNEINTPRKVISLATYLKRATMTDAELLALYKKGCFQNQAPSWARLGSVPDIMRKLGKLNTLIAYLVTPNDANGCELLNILIKHFKFETPTQYYADVANEMTKEPFSYQLGSLCSSISFIARRRPAVHVQGYKMEDLTSQLEAALARIEELEAAQAAATR